MRQKLRQTVAALASAAAAFAGPALAETVQAGCTISDAGLPATIDRYLAAAQACVAAPPQGVAARADLETQTLAAINATRSAAGLAPLAMRPALADAARVHTIDMAARGYAAHVDPEGRGHLERIRILDRTGLIGSAGGNVAILEPGDDVASALSADGVNRDNALRAEFTDAGIGVVESGGRLFATVVFARVDGDLDKPLPATAERIAGLRSDLETRTARFDRISQATISGLRLTDAGGAVLAQSPGRSIRTAGAGDAYLDVAVDEGDAVLYLRGPAIHSGS